MKFVRHVHQAAASGADCDSQTIAYTENCCIQRAVIAPGKGPWTREPCASDQIYFVLAGVLDIEIDTERYQAGPNTLVLVPAGASQRFWNSGTEAEVHLELIAPTPLPTRVRRPRAAAGDASEVTRIRRVDPAKFNRSARDPRYTSQFLAGYHDGSHSVTVSVVDLEPGAGGPGQHIHDFDQFYLILDGALEVHVSDHRQVAQLNDLVIIPAGVPHSQVNASGARERHLNIAAPSPSTETALWDRGVVFRRLNDSTPERNPM